MPLACPVGHPPGSGTFCRLCGRDYVQSPALEVVVETPAPEVVEAPQVAPALELVLASAVAPDVPTDMPAAPPVVPLAMPPAGVPATAFPGNPVPRAGDLPVGPLGVPAQAMSPESSAPLQVSFPLVPVEAPVVPAPEPVAQDSPVSEDAPEAETAEVAGDPGVQVGVDRRTLVVATVAGFAGGLLSGAAVVTLLG